MKVLSVILSVGAALLVSACSLLNPRYQDYTFSYEFRYPGEHVAILQYELRAGDVTIEQFAPSVNQSKSYADSVSPRALGPVPQSLHVKWIDESTDKKYEETVDLRPHMPDRLDKKVIYLTLQDNKLRVYLADVEAHVTTPRNERSPYSGSPAIVLYSDY